MKKPMLATTILILHFMYSTAVEANCIQDGTVVRVQFRADQITGNHVVFLKTTPTANFYYRAVTNDDELAAAAIVLAASHTRVRINADRGSCQNTGTQRQMGKIRILIVVP